jgi:hypothetical protein
MSTIRPVPVLRFPKRAVAVPLTAPRRVRVVVGRQDRVSFAGAVGSKLRTSAGVSAPATTTGRSCTETGDGTQVVCSERPYTAHRPVRGSSWQAGGGAEQQGGACRLAARRPATRLRPGSAGVGCGYESPVPTATRGLGPPAVRLRHDRATFGPLARPVARRMSHRRLASCVPGCPRRSALAICCGGDDRWVAAWGLPEQRAAHDQVQMSGHVGAHLPGRVSLTGALRRGWQRVAVLPRPARGQGGVEQAGQPSCVGKLLVVGRDAGQGSVNPETERSSRR